MSRNIHIYFEGSCRRSSLESIHCLQDCHIPGIKLTDTSSIQSIGIDEQSNNDNC